MLTRRHTKVIIVRGHTPYMVILFHHRWWWQYTHAVGWAKGQDTTASILYSWEKNVGAAGVTCTTSAGRQCNPYDWERIPDEVLQRMVLRKAERVKSLKEWRTLSCVLYNYTGKSLDAFDTPGACTIRPQRPNETRIHRTDEVRARCFLKDDVGTEREILPVTESPGEWAQLTIGLDSGSVGRAAASYSKHKLGLFIFCRIRHHPPHDSRLEARGGVLCTCPQGGSPFHIPLFVKLQTI